MRYWDASAVVKLCLDEEQTDVADELAEENPVIAVWWATPVECASAIARRRREGLLSPAHELAAVEALDRISGTWIEIQPGQLVRSHALRLLRVHPLCAGDALQLAAALVWAGVPGTGPGSGAELVTFDERLAEAARLEGLAVLPGAESSAG